MKTWELKLDKLFESLGMITRGTVEMNENTYDFDPENPKDSWLYPVFLGLKELKKQEFNAGSFATIGTGSGIDSIGAFEIFKLKKIYQIDSHPNVPELAQKNATQIIGDQAKIETYLGDLCIPLIERNIKVDLVYANLPNLPSSKSVLDKKVSASQFESRDPEDCPELQQKWLLTLQYLFLKSSKNILNPGGVVVNAIGARIPFEVMLELYSLNGLKVEELISIYKIQSEPEDTLREYSEYEKLNGVEFDFYDHENAQKLWQEKLESKNLKTPELKNALSPFRISATQAFEAWRDNGKQAGHICSILKSEFK